MKRIIRNAALTVAALTCIASCGREEDNRLADDTAILSFDYRLESLAPASRSVLDAPDIEEMVSSISLFIYRNGRLVTSGYYEDDYSGMDFTLEKGCVYDVYALANMGDMTGKMPSDMTLEHVEDLIWEIPSYPYVNENGLPMSGHIEGFHAGTDEAVIPLKRLFAKVRADISTEYSGAEVKTVRILNLNGKLRPFGVSAAEDASSIMSEAEFDSGSGTYVFYVPENMQGQIGTATDSRSKNPDLDPDISAKKDVLTYMEVEIGMDEDISDYKGSVTYRSYLGENDTKNFDLKGNCIYSWTLTYLEDNLQYDDWKVDTGSLTENVTKTYKFLISPSSVGLEVGETASVKAYLIEYNDGIAGSMTDVTYISSWSSSDPAVATIVSKGTIEGSGSGTCSVSVRYIGYSAKCSVSVAAEPVIYTHDLTVTPSELSVTEGDYGSLKATYRTFTNGVLSESKDVTSSATWSSSTPSCVSVEGGTVKGISEGSATVTASYNGYSDAAEVNVSAKPVSYSYGLEINPSSISLTAGETGSLSAIYKTYADGVAVSETTVTAEASWSSSDNAAAAVSSGTITAKAEGSATITATYNDCSATAEVTVSPVPVYLESISVTPSSVTGYNGDRKDVSVTAHYSDGTTKDISGSCTWTSSNTSTASYSSGTVSCNATGNAVITLSYEGMSATINVTVKAIGPEQMYLSKTSVTLETGQTYQASVYQVVFNNGKTIYPSASDLTWVSADPQTASVSEGLITGLKAGSTTVTGTFSSNGMSVSCDIAVSVTEPEIIVPTLTSVSISGPAYASLAGSVQLKATAIYSDGSSKDVTSSATWYSKDGFFSSVSGGCAVPLSSSADKSGRIYCVYEDVWSDNHSITVINDVIAVSGWLETTGGMSYFGMSVKMADGTLSRVGFDWVVIGGSDPDSTGKTGSASSVGQSYSKGSYLAIIRMTSTGTFKFLENGGVTTRKAECQTNISHSGDNI